MATTKTKKLEAKKLSIETVMTTIRATEKPCSRFSKAHLLHRLLSPYYEFGMLTHVLDMLSAEENSPMFNIKHNVEDSIKLVKLVFDELLNTGNNVVLNGDTVTKKIVKYDISTNSVDKQRTILILTVLLENIEE